VKPDDDRSICRVCGQPIEKGKARYRDEEGEVHPECYTGQRRPAEAE